MLTNQGYQGKKLGEHHVFNPPDQGSFVLCLVTVSDLLMPLKVFRETRFFQTSVSKHHICLRILFLYHIESNGLTLYSAFLVIIFFKNVENWFEIDFVLESII